MRRLILFSCLHAKYEARANRRLSWFSIKTVNMAKQPTRLCPKDFSYFLLLFEPFTYLLLLSYSIKSFKVGFVKSFLCLMSNNLFYLLFTSHLVLIFAILRVSWCALVSQYVFTILCICQSLLKHFKLRSTCMRSAI